MRLPPAVITFGTYLRKNWLPIFSAFVIGLGFPLWKLLAWETPNVRLEIAALDKVVPVGITVDLTRDPDFKPLVPSDDQFLRQQMDTMVELNEVAKLLDRFEDRLSSGRTRLQELKTTQNQLQNSGPLTAETIRRYNSPIPYEVDEPNEAELEATPARREQLKQELLRHYETYIKEAEARIETSTKSLEAMRKALAKPSASNRQVGVGNRRR